MNEPGPIKFPAPKPRDNAVKLVLPRRRSASARSSVEVIDASAAARESINALFSNSRTPFKGGKTLEAAKLIELERTLRQLEQSLAERERVVAETENRLVERERDVAEMEALLFAREQLITASNHPESAQREISLEEKKALEHLRAELERQEAHLKEQKHFVRERELFLDDAENKLFEKVQAQQDKENELEQREEDLLARDRRLREREAALDPKAAARLQAEDAAAKNRDDFKE